MIACRRKYVRRNRWLIALCKVVAFCAAFCTVIGFYATFPSSTNIRYLGPSFAIPRLVESFIANESFGEGLKQLPEFNWKSGGISVKPQLALVACGDRLPEVLSVIKSALVFSQFPFHVHLFADEPLINQFRTELPNLSVLKPFDYTIYPLQFPPDGQEQVWRTLFKPCASQRLFIPEILTGVDRLIYVDTDVLFLRPLEELWSFFQAPHFTQFHLAAMAPETEDDSTNWYIRFARHPFLKPRGVNSGVMLMDLERMRAFNWTQQMGPLLQAYKPYLTWGDQDLINIIFTNHSDKVLLLGCEWNYRPDHCMYMSVCKEAERSGAALVHGSRSYFHKDKQFAFAALYDTFAEHKLGEDVKSQLLIPLEMRLRRLSGASNCGKVWPIFTKAIHGFLSLTQSKLTAA